MPKHSRHLSLLLSYNYKMTYDSSFAPQIGLGFKVLVYIVTFLAGFYFFGDAVGNMDPPGTGKHPKALDLSLPLVYVIAGFIWLYRLVTKWSKPRTETISQSVEAASATLSSVEPLTSTLATPEDEMVTSQKSGALALGKEPVALLLPPLTKRPPFELPVDWFKRYFEVAVVVKTVVMRNPSAIVRMLSQKQQRTVLFLGAMELLVLASMSKTKLKTLPLEQLKFLGQVLEIGPCEPKSHKLAGSCHTSLSLYRR